MEEKQNVIEISKVNEPLQSTSASKSDSVLAPALAPASAPVLAPVSSPVLVSALAHTSSPILASTVSVSGAKEKIKLVITKKEGVKVELVNKLYEETKEESDETKEKSDETKEELAGSGRSRYFCYILKNRIQSEIKKTYNGFTVDLKRRIRQHNSEIKGGAKYTTSNGRKTWHYYAILTGFDSSVSALSCEWWIKHPTGTRRPMKYSGPRGRILGLQQVVEEVRFKGYDKALEYTLWIDRAYLSLLNPRTIKPNIKIMTFTKLEDITNYYDILDKSSLKAT